MFFDQYRSDTPTGPEAATRLRGRVFQHAPHVVYTSLRGETVVFDIERGKYESLNEVATSVWERMATGATFDSIVSAMQEEYELPTESALEQMTADVAALIVRLQKARVITSEPLAQVART
jgi:hypothetical protein